MIFACFPSSAVDIPSQSYGQNRWICTFRAPLPDFVHYLWECIRTCVFCLRSKDTIKTIFLDRSLPPCRLLLGIIKVPQPLERRMICCQRKRVFWCIIHEVFHKMQHCPHSFAFYNGFVSFGSKYDFHKPLCAPVRPLTVVTIPLGSPCYWHQRPVQIAVQSIIYQV